MKCAGLLKAGAALFVIAALSSCYNIRQYTTGRSGTIAGLIIVKDADTGEPLESASVLIKEGFREFIVSERTDTRGEMMFSKRYEARGVSDDLWPPHLIIEVYKDGYEGLKQSVNTEHFVFGYGDKEVYKKLELKLRRGEGVRRVEGYKPAPYSGN